MLRAPLLLHVLALPLAAQADWQLVTTATSPNQPFHTAMTHDLARGTTVLFGGTNNAVTFNETWEYAGTDWTLVNPPTSPSARWWARMTYDVGRSVCVLFGGDSGSGETWEYDGVTWTLRQPPTQPPPRYSHGMWYDLTRGLVMMFGGNPRPAGTILNDTWAWDGTDWAQLQPANPPPPLWSIDVAYDLARDRAVVFGGANSNTVATNQTFEWDGSDWAQVMTPTAPTPRWGNKVAYSIARRRVVMVGGVGPGGATDDTWEYDGFDWHRINPPTSLTARENHALTYDLGRGMIIAYGGFPPINDTWEYADRSAGQFLPYGAGCAGSAGVPVLDAQTGSVPLIGQSLLMEIQSLPAGTSVVIGAVGISDTNNGATALPFSLAPIGMPGCRQFAGDFGWIEFLASGGGPIVPWSISIPNNPLFTGLEMFTQVVVPDPAANAQGLIVTNAAKLTVG